jgi:ADP-ribose pyrophosphatase YjhB (NUDIX family)
MHSRQPHASDKREVQIEVSAGGIVFKRTVRGVRIAFILDPFSKWAFAKGHVEEGETILNAAIRETREEMGIYDLHVVAPLGTIDFWFRERYNKENKGVMIHKYVHYYLMEAPAYVKGRPQKKERIRKIIWVSLRRLVATSSYDDVRPILDRVMEHFAKERGAQTVVQEPFGSREVLEPRTGRDEGERPSRMPKPENPEDIMGDLGEPLRL